jgi:hypothetical protein
MFVCFSEVVIDEEALNWFCRKSAVTQYLFGVSFNLLFLSKRNRLLRAILASKDQIVLEVSSMDNII